MNAKDPLVVNANGSVTLEPFCLARCCECFHIPLTTLQQLAKDPYPVEDGEFIKDMLIWLDDETAIACHESWGFANWQPESGEFYFTCKHWDFATRLCKVYDKRPHMCRRHPIGQCTHGCGLNG